MHRDYVENKVKSFAKFHKAARFINKNILIEEIFFLFFSILKYICRLDLIRVCLFPCMSRKNCSNISSIPLKGYGLHKRSCVQNLKARP